jgi:acetyl esterase/lipase
MNNAATLLVVLLLHVFSPNTALNALAPTGGITISRDIPYDGGDTTRRRLDIYAPLQTASPAPVVVFFYGGGWTSGNKEMYRYLGADLAAHGVLTVIPDYRLFPDVRFPAFMEDAAQAVAWVRTNAARFGGAPNRLFLMGHSAGAQIATLLAMDPHYLQSVHLTTQQLCGVIGLGGPYDFLPSMADLGPIFGARSHWPESQPINFVSAQEPPILLLAGGMDHTIDPASTTRFADRLRAAGAAVQDRLYWGVSHKALIAAFSGALSFVAPVREDALRFIDAHPACGAGAAWAGVATLP